MKYFTTLDVSSRTVSICADPCVLCKTYLNLDSEAKAIGRRYPCRYVLVRDPVGAIEHFHFPRAGTRIARR